MALTPQQRKLLEKRLSGEGLANGETALLEQWQADPQNWYNPFPLTDVQYAYWLGRMSGFALGRIGSHGYQEWGFSSLDLTRYEQAWNSLIARHGMLRAVIQDDGQQRILPKVPWFTIQTVDCRDCSDEVLTRVRDDLRARLSHRCYEPDVWPCFSIEALLLPAGRVVVCISADALFGDVYSGAILRQELKELYDFPERALPELNFSFRDYVCWLQHHETSEEFIRARKWWQQKAGQLPPAPALPVLTTLPDTPLFTRRALTLSGSQWERLQTLGRRKGLSPSSVMLSAYVWLLARWSGSRYFTLNMTLFNRIPVHPEVVGVMGDFTQTLLLACNVEPQTTFCALAERLQQDFAAAFEYRQYSGVRVLRDYVKANATLQGKADTTLMPFVFTSGLGVSEKLAQHEAFGELEYEITQTPQVLIDNQVFERDGELVVQWDAVEQAFPGGLLTDMFSTLGALLQALADDTDAWNQVLPVGLPTEQRHQRLAVNQTDCTLEPQLLHAAAYRCRHQCPDVPAVIFAGKVWTREQLWCLAERIAMCLGEEHGKAEFIGVALPHGVLQVAALLGVSLAGYAWVPVDIHWPIQRCERVIKRAGIRRILVAKDSTLSLSGVEAIVVDETLPPVSPSYSGRLVSCDAPAYAIFTSGSTGEPKGVVISHKAAWNTLADILCRFEVDERDVVLNVSAISFDLSVFDIFGVLGAGGVMVMPDRGRERDIEHWRALINQYRVTVWNSVPALLELVLAQAGDLHSLRLVLLSGDWIPISLTTSLLRDYPSVRLISLGGATEAAIWSVWHPVGQHDTHWQSIPYGTPLANQRLYVLDSQLNDLPDWVAGDLYIAGEGLAVGYLNDEERTREAFIFDPQRGERLYRTGDRVRYRPGSILEFLGRADNQIKLSGYRIEPGEIETAMLSCPGIRQAVVVVTGQGRQRRLLGYVSGIADETRLHEHLADHLPAYMIPDQIQWLDFFPLTANGKVDRQQLPAPDMPVPHTNSVPTTVAEQRLLALLSEELGYPVSDPLMNLFDLGAGSVTVVNLHQRLVREWCPDLPLMTLFRRTRLRDLAATLEGTDREDNTENQDRQRAKTRGAFLEQRQQRRTGRKEHDENR
ncbi:amino acid adenylation domain-containing protein [Salmonella enterica subsp. enterica serovar Infantis]|nr:amino acid adenylation domain-containing protein [Salmonella enterica]EHA1743121.1 amino acid adenylation domain-containing protein [Salmonella enterica subsp. enterica serovar Javiana]EHC4525253.1 amino acid adenylation domain-containing protein [Salmonella enterica subsp. enterica serovar Infantis]ECL4818264.1 amino acid adenylation domain-containing protein [Salmonella enterica]EHJ8320779.1 amino acid adenylation domain-containing protein [Salmonella enterica subsp. enterica serovar Infan